MKICKEMLVIFKKRMSKYIKSLFTLFCNTHFQYFLHKCTIENYF